MVHEARPRGTDGALTRAAGARKQLFDMAKAHHSCGWAEIMRVPLAAQLLCIMQSAVKPYVLQGTKDLAAGGKLW